MAITKTNSNMISDLDAGSTYATVSSIPTNNNQLTNGAGYITDSDVASNAAVAANTAKVTNATHTGDATGDTALTLATVNSNVGSFTNANITVNAKGLVTAASNGTGGVSVYTSSETSIPATNTTETWTHSLGQAPDLIQLILRCKTAEYGYSVGDEIRFTSEYTYNVGVYAFWANASTIGFRHYTVAGTVFNIPDRSIVNTVRNPTPANWRIVVKGIVF